MIVGHGPLTRFFTSLTDIYGARIAAEGVPLGDALERFDAFSDEAVFWSRGKDEFKLLAISCYLAGIAPVMPARRFGNAAHLFAEAGMPLETIHKLGSPGLPELLGIDGGPLRAHDALGDGQSVPASLQHLIVSGRLDPKVLRQPWP